MLRTDATELCQDNDRIQELEVALEAADQHAQTQDIKVSELHNQKEDLLSGENALTEENEFLRVARLTKLQAKISRLRAILMNLERK